MPAPTGEPTFTSYREKLRAGGRGALQRAIDCGLMPKNMKQDWTLQGAVTHMNGIMQQPDGQHCSGVSSPVAYTPSAGSAPAWNMEGTVQQGEFWPEQQHQQMTTQLPNPQMQMPFAPCLPQYTQQVQQHTLQMPQVGLAQMHVQPMQMAQTQLTPVGDSTPTEFDRCMAIVMPDMSQLPCDKDVMAAQLRAAADCRYED
jgi:hypothetical protein